MAFRKFILIVVAVLAFGYVAYAMYYWFAQTGMIFPADEATEVARVRLAYPDIREFWPEADGQKVEAWYLPPLYDDPILDGWPGSSDSGVTSLDEYIPSVHDRGPAPLLVIAHGNATLIDVWPRQVDDVRAAGIGVLLVEYPSYGRSPGTPGQDVIVDLFAAGYDSVMAWGWADPERVVALGRSLGGGVACAFSQVRDTDALILVSTFTSVRSFAADYGLPGFLVRHPFDNEAVLSAYDKPVLLVHSVDDTKVPYEHALALAAASETDTLITRNNDGHDTLQGHWPQFWREAGLPFLKRVIQ